MRAATGVEAHRQAMLRSNAATICRAKTSCRQATNIKDLGLPMLLPGVRVNTSPDSYFPIRQLQPARFDGKGWGAVGGLMSG
jgi:hypothetical protein